MNWNSNWGDQFLYLVEDKRILLLPLKFYRGDKFEKKKGRKDEG